jgi:membrane-associated phospholipid phosphatase
MAASRVYLAVHHVSDVVVGLAVGACTGAAFALVAA